MSIQIRAACLVSAAIIASAATAQTAVEWKVSEGGNGHWYGIRSRNIPDMTWMQMRDAAVECGGHLVTISNGPENAFAFNFWTSQNLDMMPGPLGYFVLPGGQWQSVTGEPLSYTNWRPSLSNPPLNAAPDNGNAVHRFATWLDVGSWGALGGKWEDWLDSELGNPANPMSQFLVEWDADCNSDGVVDYGQILRGELADLNTNGVPDICELSMSGVVPVSGPSGGGTTVTINGTGFPQNPLVKFGGTPSTNVVRHSLTRITATIPPHLPGNVEVSVGTWTSPDAFYYRPECGSDLDQNGSVDAGDISIILLDFGPCFEPPVALAAPAPTPLLADEAAQKPTQR